MARSVESVRLSAQSIAAGLAVERGGVAQAAAAVGVSRGSFDAWMSGRHGMSVAAAGKVAAYLNSLDRAPGETKRIVDQGRLVAFTSGGQRERVRSEVQRLKTYDETTRKKEIQFFVKRQEELKGRQSTRGGSGGGGGGYGGGPNESSDFDWYAEYGAWVEEIESWGTDNGELPDVEDLPW